MPCDTCSFYEYDEEDEAYYCSVDMDEDDYVRLMTDKKKDCPFYQNADEYSVVRHQAF